MVYGVILVIVLDPVKKVLHDRLSSTWVAPVKFKVNGVVKRIDNIGQQILQTLQKWLVNDDVHQLKSTYHCAAVGLR